MKKTASKVPTIKISVDRNKLECEMFVHTVHTTRPSTKQVIRIKKVLEH